MLNEFLEAHLKEIESERKDLTDRLDHLNQQETEFQKKISVLLEKEDVGMELFSPRSTGDTTKEKIEAIQKEVEEIQLNMAHISDLIAENREKKEKYENLLKEAHKETDSELSENDSLTAALSGEGLKKSSFQGLSSQEASFQRSSVEESLNQGFSVDGSLDRRSSVKKSAVKESLNQGFSAVGSLDQGSTVKESINQTSSIRKSDCQDTGSHIRESSSRDSFAKNQQEEDSRILVRAAGNSQTAGLNNENSETLPLDHAASESEEHRQELLEIMKRVDKCLNYSHDRNKCKNELKSLQYYLKALLSQKR